ncbi:MAG: hypothetical protein HOE53_02520 [Candidatus Magasanikbacteria bacterium]|nr:hypothetical protein [Candidatus Magasanikbacteria bacterium]
MILITPTFAASTYFSDEFDTVAHAELSTRVPDTGTSWSQLIDNGRDLYVRSYNDHVTTESNGSNVGTLYQANGTYDSADYEILARIAFSGGDSNYTRSLAVRIQDASNMYLLRAGSGASGLAIYKRTAGTWSLLGSTSYTPTGDLSVPYNDAGDIIGLRAEGNDLSALVNGTVQLTVTDSDHTLAGSAGIGTGYVNISTDDSGTGVGIDNVIVQDLVDDTAPTVSYYNPADNATGVSATSTFEISFDEAIVTSTGNIYLYKTSDDSLIETIDIESALVTASSTTALVIDPAAVLISQTEYYFFIDATAVDDTSANSYAGITVSTTWSFTTADTTDPTLLYVNPADNATGVGVTSTFEIAFDEAIATSTGNIYIYKTNDNSLIETIDIEGALVTASSTNALIIDPVATLDSNTEYYFLIDITAIDDSAGNSYAGIALSTAWSFTTTDTAAPTISGASPTGEQDVGTATVTVSVTTDEAATCKYAASAGAAFAAKTVFSSTGATSHTTSVSTEDDTSYSYYVSCQDGSTNESTETTITFSIAAPVTGGGGSAPAPAPSVGVGTSDAFIPMGTTKDIGPVSVEPLNILTHINSPAEFEAPVSGSGAMQPHSFEITDFDLFENIITLKIQSEPQFVTLSLNETASVDLDGDGIADVSLTFEDVVTNRAEITLQVLTEESELTIPVEELPSTPVSPTPVVPKEPAVFTFTRNLSLGMQGTDVQELQKYLNTKGFAVAQAGYGSAGNETTYFGNATKSALIKYQTEYQLPAYGYFGDLTRTFIISGDEPLAIKQTVQPKTTWLFTKDLRLGDQDSEVQLLQQYLNAHDYIVADSGYGSPGNETTYFGAATQAALIKYQEQYRLPAYGYFGPLTRSSVK